MTAAQNHDADDFGLTSGICAGNIQLQLQELKLETLKGV